MITLKRCRSHNVNNTPMEWESVAEHQTPADAIRDFWDFQQACRASGDQFAIVVDGVPQEILSETELAPQFTP